MTTTSPPPIDVDDAETSRTRRRPSWPITLGLLLTVVVAGFFAARILVGLFQPHLYSGTVLQSPTPAPAMEGLVLANGEPLDMAAFEGDVVMLYFGYTNCPDVCPTTLSTAARARAALSEAEQERAHLVMVSVDPNRDPVDELQGYVEFFDPDFVGAGGTADDIATAAAQYGVYYVLNGDDVDEGYTVDHTANLLGVGPDGRLRVIWAPDVSSNALQADIEALLD